MKHTRSCSFFSDKISVTPQQQVVFKKRLRAVHVPWKKWITKVSAHDALNMLELRENIIAYMKWASGQYITKKKVRDKIDEHRHNDLDTCGGESQRIVPIPTWSPIVTEGTINTADCRKKLLSRPQKSEKAESLPHVLLQKHCKPFILDFGSSNKTSNSDLTIMNAPSVNIVPFLVDGINNCFGYDVGFQFDELSLKDIFEISIYVNSFLLNVGGAISYIDCSSDSATQTKQRRHAKNRLLTFLRPGDAGTLMDSIVGLKHNQHQHGQTRTRALREMQKDRKKIDSLIRRKTMALFSCQLCKVVQLTSETTYLTSDDAYHSQAAFLHVLIEIQSRTLLPLSPSDYLNSAYDNIGLLLQISITSSSAAKKNRRSDSAVFSKYVSRTTHALGRAVSKILQSTENTNTNNHEDAWNTQTVITNIVAFFDNVSEVDMSKSHISCSTGTLSSIVQRQNAEHNTFMTTVYLPQVMLDGYNSKCAYYVPHRKLRMDTLKFCQKTYEMLSGVERQIDLASKKKFDASPVSAVTPVYQRNE